MAPVEIDRYATDMVQRTKTQAAEAFTKFENALFISEDSLTAKISDVEKVAIFYYFLSHLRFCIDRNANSFWCYLQVIFSCESA